MSSKKQGMLAHTKRDVLAAVVVFIVALPLCLGIALASGAPLFAGLIAGIIGGIIIGSISSSPLSVSGPAAGLVVIVVSAIEDLGTFPAFLMAVVLAGVIQIIFSQLKAGIIRAYFPSSVVKGMLAAIGLILILKQFPHLIGFDSDAFGEEEFNQPGGFNTFTFLQESLKHVATGSALIGVFSLLTLLLWDKQISPRIKALQQVPGSLVVVVLAIILNQVLNSVAPGFAVASEHMVSLPTITTSNFVNQITLPDFSALSSVHVYVVAGTLALVASLESLLSLEAIERLDPEERKADANRELLAQGVGNTLSGLIGGLPITAVIVRSSANLNAGAKSKLSAILHGALLLFCVLLIPDVLNMIPLSALAAVLIIVGYKLTSAKQFKAQFKLGWKQFIPFVVTFGAILFTDLLIGILIGMASSVVFILVANYQVPFYRSEYGSSLKGNRRKIVLRLSEQVTFLNRASLQAALEEMPNDVEVVIDGQLANQIDYDVLEIIYQFAETAQSRKIDCQLIGIPELTKNN